MGKIFQGKILKEQARKSIDEKYGSGAYDSLGIKVHNNLSSVLVHSALLSGNAYKSQLEEYRDKKNNIFTSGNMQGENIGSGDGNNDSGVITRGSILNYRDKQKRQGLFGNIGTILGN